MVRILFFFTIGFTAFSLSGQQAMTLKECIVYGIEHNLDMQNVQIAQEEARISERLSKLAQYPTLSGNINLGTNFGRTIDPVSNQFVTSTFVSNGASLSGGVILYNAGRLRNAIKQARIMSDRVDDDAQQLKNDIALKIAQGYMNALLAKENKSIIALQHEAVLAQYKNLEKLVDAGTRARADLAEIESQIAVSEQHMLTAANNLETTLLILKQDMLFPMDQKLDLVAQADITASIDPDIVDAQELYTYVLKNHHSILAAQKALQASTLGIDIAKSNLLPSVSLGGNLGSNYSNQSKELVKNTPVIVEQDATINGNPVKLGFAQAVPSFKNKAYGDQFKDNLSYGLGLQVSIPIYARGQNQATVQQAKLNEEKAKINLRKIENGLYGTIQRAVHDARAAKKKYIAAQKRKAAAAVVYNHTKKKYEIGGVDTYRYLDAQNRHQQSQINETVAKYEYIFASKVLDFYAGRQLF